MKLGSIGLRLTLWYAGIMFAALLAFCGGLWFALEHSLITPLTSHFATVWKA